MGVGGEGTVLDPPDGTVTEAGGLGQGKEEGTPCLVYMSAGTWGHLLADKHTTPPLLSLSQW